MITKREEYKRLVMESFCNLLEEKGLDWKRGWNLTSDAPRNAITERTYRGINRVYLAIYAIRHGLKDPRWATFQQIADPNEVYHKGEKWHLRKGAKGLPVEYWMPFDLKQKRIVSWEHYRKWMQSEERKPEEFSLKVKFTTVFHASDIDGIPTYEKEVIQNPFTVTKTVETIAKNMGVPLLYDGGNQAFYRPAEDKIHLPEPGQFLSEYDLNATTLHELAHATGHTSRLNRKSLVTYGEDLRPYEELVAELSSSFMGYVSEEEQTGEHLKNHKAYLQSWIQELRNDPKVFMEAVKEAEKVTYYMEYQAELISQLEYQEQTGKILEIQAEGVVQFDKAEHSEKESEKETKMDQNFSLSSQKNRMEALKERGYRFDPADKREFYDRIKREISIIGYAGRLGFTPVRKGRYWSLREHDSVIIDPEKNCFWRNSGLGSRTSGSVIDFAMAFGDMSLVEALQTLEKEIDTSSFIQKQANLAHTEDQRRNEKEQRKEGELQLPERGGNMKRVFAYLIKTRGIDPEIVQAFVDHKQLYQDQKGNCVFVAWEEETPVFGCIRGTHTEKRFLKDVEGSSYEKGFYIKNGSCFTIMTESVIDAMSVMSILKAQGLDYAEYDYMILAGVEKAEPVLRKIGANDTQRIFLALDNDQAGRDAAVRIEETVQRLGIQVEQMLPAEKDWNKELVEGKKAGKELKFFRGEEREVKRNQKKEGMYRARGFLPEQSFEDCLEH